MTETKPTNVIEALLCVMRALPAIGKDQQASAAQGGYSYRGIEAITAHTQSLFASYGVLFVPRVVRWEIRDIVVNGKPWTDTVEEVEYTVYGPGGVEDTIIVGPLLAIGRDNADKGGNKCLTQAFKYALIQALCISDAKDDSDHGSPGADALPEPQPEDERAFAWRRTREAIERGVPREVAERIRNALGADLNTAEGATVVAIAVEGFERTGELPQGAEQTPEAPQEPPDEPDASDLAGRLKKAAAAASGAFTLLLGEAAKLCEAQGWQDADVKAVLGSSKRRMDTALMALDEKDLGLAVEMLRTAAEAKV